MKLKLLIPLGLLFGLLTAFGQVMTYEHFTNFSDAQAYCAAQTALMNLPTNGITTNWANPILLNDGTYVCPAYQDTNAVPWQTNWVLASSTNAGP